MIEIEKAIDKKNLKKVQKLCGQDKSLWEYASDYVTDTERVNFIAKFLKIGMLVTGYALLTLCRKYDIADSVVKKTGISLEDLVIKSAQADPILSLEKFMSLLNRMSNDNGLKLFLSISTRYLFLTGHTDLIYSRLDALDSGSIRHADARDHQILLHSTLGLNSKIKSGLRLL